MCSQALVIDHDAKQARKDNVTFADGGSNGDGDVCHGEGIEEPGGIVADALDEDGEMVEAKFFMETPPLSLDGEVDHAEDCQSSVDEPDGEDRRRFLARDAGDEVHEGHGDGAEACQEDTFFEDTTVIVEMCVMIGDGKGNADERAGDEEKLRDGHFLFPQEDTESNRDRKFHSHDRFNDRDLAAFESLEIEERCEECDDCYQPQERCFPHCEVVEIIMNERKKSDGSKARDAEERFPCANEACGSLNEEIAEAPTEERAEGEEEAHVSW